MTAFMLGCAAHPNSVGIFKGFFPLSTVFLLTAWRATTLVWP